eukprot:CAMPEP_0195106442 /NCGR_PEP_ID=MMETSP0448-20130528/80768_1 /TAXON_ID=66468 /ORGANISM="Heterocapsa triquestra, Strain CCMP 448" /LENGTH=58 /DNA_ID=CAMNT_0040142701 /DNA_START=67 /DNA_END=240 /DNA_ORIENTATION=+
MACILPARALTAGRYQVFAAASSQRSRCVYLCIHPSMSCGAGWLALLTARAASGCDWL